MSSVWADLVFPPINLWSMPCSEHYTLHHGSLQDPDLWKEYMNTVTIYSATWCAPCTLLKNALKEEGIEYTSIDIQSEEYQQSGMTLRSVPTAVITDPEGNVVATLNGHNLLKAIKDAR